MPVHVWIVERNGKRCENDKTLTEKTAKKLRDRLAELFPNDTYIAKPRPKVKK